MSRLLRSLIPRRQAVAVSDDLARTFRTLQADPQVAAGAMAQQARFSDGELVDDMLRSQSQVAASDVLFSPANPSLTRSGASGFDVLLRDAIEAGGSPGGDVVEMLARNERMRTLDRVNAQRGRATRGRLKGLPTNERQSLWDVAQQGIADARSARMADAARSQDMSDAADFAMLAGSAGLGAAAVPMAGYVLTQTDKPESALPVEERDVPGIGYDPYRAMLPPTQRDDGSVYLEPGANMSPAEPVAEWLDRETTSILPFSPDIYIPPEDESPVAAMLAMQPTEADFPMVEDAFPPLDAPTDAELKMIMQGAYESEMGGNLRKALAAGKISQDDAEDVITSPGSRTRLPAQYGSSQSMDPQRAMAFDTLVKIGKVDPKRALGIARGQIAPTMEELRMIGGKY